MKTFAVALVCFIGVSAAEQFAAYKEPGVQDYYREIAQGLDYLQSRSGQPAGGFGGGSGGGGGYGYQDPAHILPGVFPSVFLGGLGLLGAAYLSARLDTLYNDNKERLDEFEWEVEERLDKLEEQVDEGKKEDKKLDFKAKALCKLASLFNNPTYDICSEGFDAGEIVGPSSGYSRGFPLMVPQISHQES